MMIYILLGILYALVGAFVGYFVFDPDEYGCVGPVFGILSLPLLILIFLIHLMNLGLYKFIDFTVKRFKRLRRARRNKKLNERHKERYTRCDVCERLSECRREGPLLDVTRFDDDERHFILSKYNMCKKKEEALKNDILEEI